MTLLAVRRFRGAGAATFAALALLRFTALPLAAQQTLVGVVVRDGGGPVPNAAITLHRVTRKASGPVAKTVAGADGTFRIVVPAPTAAPDPAGGGFNVYFATAQVDGVRYFGRALHAGETAAGYRIVAYDTTSAPAYADSVKVVRRDVAMIPEAQGGWEVGEVMRIQNVSHRTLVPAAGPIVSLGLPEGATSFEVGEGEFGEKEVLHMRGRIYLSAPLTPGGRELFVRYRILKGRTLATLPVTLPTDTLNVFLRLPAPDARVSGLRGPRPFFADGERYQQYAGVRVPKGAKVQVTWTDPFASPVDPKLSALVLTALVLLAGLFIALRRGRRDSDGGSADGPDGGGGGSSADPVDAPETVAASSRGGTA
ncbi:MAG: hypothetical protein JWM27_4667 [Gemmatimonadetes bacterium]|nr:hypothetical protein [Gemmatimonadota bacterium]